MRMACAWEVVTTTNNLLVETPETEKQALGETRASEKRALDRRLEGLGWGLFLILTGGLRLIPNVPEGALLVGVGVILLGLNGVRYLCGIRMRMFSMVLGLAAIGLGVGIWLGLGWQVWLIILIVIGASIILDLTVPSDARPSTPR
jgi:hypothetical protein